MVGKVENDSMYQQIQLVLREIQTLLETCSTLIDIFSERELNEVTTNFSETKSVYGIDVESQKYFLSKQKKYKGYSIVSINYCFAAKGKWSTATNQTTV
ncbi:MULTISPECIES: hypothetical protein [unclassified Enterococcus]|uniref:hypothetical protein n=1 Tax=unclassified Enterococcus TaxID=2608891 RepID=UPI000A33EEEF|nr:MULTISPECIES: hypothetical protein [unclassified Enterococcus]